MINLMYILLMAMLALNVSNDVLKGFHLIGDSYERTTTNAAKENRALYDDFTVLMKKNNSSGPSLAKQMGAKEIPIGSTTKKT